ncbi:TIGR04423 family type III CRISPR-associated protein [Desulfobacter latus]|uniref:TIGR04423 family type III CRISPR-associated protein n=1 Tax=Desulfobacter latus TaxID=2292 RepID=A0A850SV14_9BACT|nr:TIGR04423 family type III CRISPR-associated protein [Desulfobacter latus]NWH03870.1 TIGR04423 family type III CRISPR-associated protein [Desulfobacter latus]
MANTVCKKIDTLAPILSKAYTGYYWLSDADHPVILENRTIQYQPVLNPFIIEGRLFCDQENTSISIRHIDGQYLIYQIFWDQVASENEISEDQLSYLAASGLAAAGIKRLKFRRLWQDQKEKNCEDMRVLLPGPVGFIGFEMEENHD